MHGRSAGVVEPAHPERPTGGVPRPAGDGVVDERRPDEHEGDGRQHPAPLCRGADGQRYRQRRQHTLVHGEEEVRDAVAPDGGTRQDALETGVAQVADEGVGRPREGQRVAPHEPLHRRHGQRQDGEEHQREGRLASCEA